VVAKLLEQYRVAYDAWRDTERRLERLRGATASDQARAQYLRDFIADMEKLDPQPGELTEIEEQINRLSNVEALRVASATAHSAISAEDGGPDGLSLLGAARRALESSGDAELMRLAQEVSLQIESLGEVSRSLASYLTDLEADPARLDQLQNRKAELNALCKRHGGELEDLITRRPEAQTELLDLDSGEDQIEKLEQLLEGQLSQLSGVAGLLTAARKQAGVEFSAEVGGELANLAMSGARLDVQITELPNFESHGADRIEILLASHPGAAPRPLGKGASGGELSRIMLAIELVLADKQPLPTLIFDEVDAGVGGAAAVELGRRLQRLAENTQVIVVTHLPQVAAFAHHQIRIKKDSSGGFTVSSASEITGAERELELARMLSGNPESEVALQHARELLRESAN
jgi:DNA repair protein RecN (Recombination protein N)